MTSGSVRSARNNRRTCEACRHHRPLTEAPEGRKLCAVCLEKEEIPCPKSHQLMPVGRGNECETCYDGIGGSAGAEGLQRLFVSRHG